MQRHETIPKQLNGRQENLESTADRMAMSIAQMMEKLSMGQSNHASTMKLHEEALLEMRAKSTRMVSFQENQEHAMQNQTLIMGQQKSDNDRLAEQLAQQQADSRNLVNQLGRCFAE